MIRTSVLPRSEAILKFAMDHVGYRKPTEIVYVAAEFIEGKFSTTNICYRTANPKSGKRGEPSELTSVDKVFVKADSCV